MKVAALQCNSGSDIEENIRVITQKIEAAAHAGAQLVALPENCFQMEEAGLGASRITYALEDHPGMHAARALASQYKVWILVGSLAIKVDDSGKTPNRSLLFDNTGKLVASYDKIHLFDVELPSGEVYAESNRMQSGEHAVTAQTPWAKLGLTICYDVRFPHLYRALAKAGADILMVPAAFTAVTGEAHWHVLLRARAIENGCFVVAPAQIGSHPAKRTTYGHALIVDPWGNILAEAADDDDFVMADLDISQVNKVRQRIPSLQHDRPYALSE